MKEIWTWIVSWLNAGWTLTGEMAPYLLFGFFMAGLLRILVRQDFVERHLGGAACSKPSRPRSSECPCRCARAA